MIAFAVIFTLVIFIATNNAGPVKTAPGFSSGDLSYLARFGYYKYPDASVGAIANEETIQASIRSLQRYAGIPETGLLDAPTKEIMKQPRCGMADISQKLKTRRKRRFTLQGTAWKKSDLTWRLLNDNNDELTREQVESVMYRAFSKWQAVTNLNFKMLHHTTTAPVDIEVKFVQDYHNDPYPFDGQGGTLAHAFYPHNNEGLAGDVHFDDAEHFTIGKRYGRSLLWVAVHEIGHSIGLEHSNLKTAVMYPWYRGGNGGDFPLNYDDISGIQHLYGSRANPVKPTKPSPSQSMITSEEIPVVACTNTMKTVFLDRSTGVTYIINNDKVYMLSKELKIVAGPIELQKLFPGLTSVDSAYRRTDGRIVFFKDMKYYIYDGVRSPQQMETGSIFNKYKGLDKTVTKIDGAFVWSGNGRTYLFTSSKYYRYDEYRQSIDLNYPRDITSAWKGVPAYIDDVFIWTNGVTYFFKGTNYYRLDSKYVRVKPGYPKEISKAWTKCSGALIRADASGGDYSVNSNLYSTLISLFTIFIAKLLQ